jgi:hypothetical protein
MNKTLINIRIKINSLVFLLRSLVWWYFVVRFLVGFPVLLDRVGVRWSMD